MPSCNVNTLLAAAAGFYKLAPLNGERAIGQMLGQIGYSSGDNAAALRASADIYVDPYSGSDTTGARGNLGLPYRTIEAAVAASQAGDVILLGAGTHNLGNGVRVPTGGAIIGVSQADTYVQFWQLNTVSFFPIAFQLSTNCYLGHMTVECMYRNTTSSGIATFQGVLGCHKNYTNSSYTGAVVWNVKGYGGTDVFYNRHTATCTASLYNCTLLTQWDAIAWWEAAHQFDFYNVDCEALGPNHITGSTTRSNCVSSDNLSAGNRLRFFGGYLRAENGVNGGQLIDANASGMAVEFYGTRFLGPGAVNFSLTAPDQILFSNCTVDTAKLVTDLEAATVTLADFLAGTIYFGSGTVGEGPSIARCTDSPEGVVYAAQGSMRLRLNGGATTTLYVKTTALTSNQGWVAK